MGQPPQTGFYAADEDGHVPVGLADEIAVHDGGPVRPLAHDATGGEGVGLPAVMGHGIVVYHGVHIAPCDQKAQSGPSQGADGFGILPVWLGENPHFIPRRLQNPADDGVAKGGMVHVGVTNDIDKVALFPSPGCHICPGDWQKFRHRNASHFKFCLQYTRNCPKRKALGRADPHRRGSAELVGGDFQSEVEMQ